MKLTRKINPACIRSHPSPLDAASIRFRFTVRSDSVRVFFWWLMKKLARFILPYVAGIITRTRFRNWKSRLIDRLIVLSEE